MRHSPSCLCCLPGRPFSPCLLASACFLPLAPLFRLVRSARLVVRGPGWCWWLPLLCGFGLFCWRGLFFVWFVCVVLFCVVCLWLVFRFRVVLLLFPPLSFFSGPFVCFAPTCATKVLVYHCTCVSDRRLDRFTCTVYLHRVTMFLLQCSCVTICRVLR